MVEDSRELIEVQDKAMELLRQRDQLLLGAIEELLPLTVQARALLEQVAASIPEPFAFDPLWSPVRGAYGTLRSTATIAVDQIDLFQRTLAEAADEVEKLGKGRWPMRGHIPMRDA